MERKQWIFEDGEGVDLANRKMDGESGGRNQPAAVSCRGNGAVTIEKSHGHSAKTSGVRRS
jgi:hypothetical protein